MKRMISVIVICLMLLSVIGVGCTQQEEKTDPAPSKSEQGQEQAKEKEPVTLELMHWWAYVEDEILEQFQDRNPHVTIDNQYVAPDQYSNRIKLLSATNELPDVFGIMGPDTQDFIEQGLVKELSYLLEEKAYDQEMAFGETIEPSLLEAAQSHLNLEQRASGKQYLLPFGAITVAVVYNKTIFDELGIDEPRNWDELLSNNDKLKEAGYIPLSFTGKNWGDWWYRIALEQNFRDKATQEDFLSGDAKWTDQEAVDAFNTIKEMWNKDHFDPGGFTSGIEESQALFVQQRMAQFYVVPENFVTYLIQNTPKEVEIGAYPLPAMVDGMMPKGLGGAPNTLSLNVDSNNKEIAGDLIKYLISETTFGKLADVAVVPSLKGYTPPEGDNIMKAFADAAEGGFITNPFPHTSEFIQWLKEEGFPNFLLRDVDTEKFLEEVQEKFENMVME